MRVQNKQTKEVYELHSMGPGLFRIIVNGRQVDVNEENYKLELETHLYCTCENRKEQPRIDCPYDGEPCNCCSFCQKRCCELKTQLVMPTRAENTDWLRSFDEYNQGWNDCIDEFVRINKGGLYNGLEV